MKLDVLMVDPEHGSPSPVSDAQVGSLAELYRDSYGAMVRLAYLLTDSNALAEELVQDAFVKIHGRWDGLDQPRAYLRTTVVNGCRSHLRRAVLVLKFYADMSEADIASALGCRPGTVKSLSSRALDALRKVIEP